MHCSWWQMDIARWIQSGLRHSKSILLVQQWEQMEGGWSTRPPEQHIPTVLPPWLCSPPSRISWAPCVSAAAPALQLPGRAAGRVGLCVSKQGQKSESGASLCQLRGWERVMGSRTRPDVCYAYSYKLINTRVEYSKMLWWFLWFNSYDSTASFNFCSCYCSFPLIIHYIIQSYVVSNKY